MTLDARMASGFTDPACHQETDRENGHTIPAPGCDWCACESGDLRPRTPRIRRVRPRLVKASKEALDDAGIEIPFPHLQLFIDDAKGLKPVLQPLYPATRTER